jgi:pimeloyl-ACP methyl ester carboxylesterase
MHYVRAGEGPLILFLHGFPEFWYSWRHQLPAFAGDYTVVAPDQRGYAETDHTGPYDVATLRADMVALIRHLGHEKAHVVAHDWGGAIAWALAMRHPEAVESLVIANSPHPVAFQRELRRFRQLRRSWYMFFFQLPWLPERLASRGNYRPMARMMIRDARPGAFTREDVMAYLDCWRTYGLGGGIDWYRAGIRGMRKGMRDAKGARVQAPTTVIWGEDDTYLGVHLLDGLEELVPGIVVHRLPMVSHWVQHEEPQEFNRLLRQHLERLDVR